MFIEKELEGDAGEVADDGRSADTKDRLMSKLQSILVMCESLEVELAEEQGRGLVLKEMDDFSKRVGVVREMAETIMGGLGTV